jgi:hypothetical protein
MVKLLTELEYEFLTATEKEIVGNIKEKNFIYCTLF